MGEVDIKNLESQVDLVSKILTLAFKIGVLIGGGCLLFYCYRLNYFPVGLSVGDGFLLTFLATSFGFLYGLFVVSLIALGLWYTPFLRPILRLVYFVYNILSKNPKPISMKLISPGFNSFIFGIFGIVFIFSFYQKEPAAIWTLPATSFLLAAILTFYHEISSKRAEILKAETAIIHFAKPNKIPNPMEDRGQFRLISGYLLACLVIIPLLMGGVSGVLLEGAMSFANIKKGESFVLLRPPYDNLIPFEYKADKAPPAPGYMAFENIEVMFSGIGEKTVIEFKKNDKVKHLEIPNDKVLVVPR